MAATAGDACPLSDALGLRGREILNLKHAISAAIKVESSLVVASGLTTSTGVEGEA
jgi:hypothetical protein